MLDPINLTARIVDPIHFVFIPETWETELKAYKQAKWTHTSASDSPSHTASDYQIKEGHFLAFPQFHMTNGGFYAAHLYAVVKELAGTCKQVHATLTVEGLTLETVGGDIKTRVTLKPRGLSRSDTPHSAVLSLDAQIPEAPAPLVVWQSPVSTEEFIAKCLEGAAPADPEPQPEAEPEAETPEEPIPVVLPPVSLPIPVEIPIPVFRPSRYASFE